MRAARPALALALSGLAASGALAFAADAPKTTATSRTLFMAQEGCGTSAEAGRLELKPQADGADGCGTVAGLPLNEVFHSQEELFGSIADDYTSTSKLPPFMIDTAKKVKGQVAASSWVGNGVGGVGTVTWDIALTGTTTTGKLIDFGVQTVSAPAAPGNDDVSAPFTFSVPKSATGLTFKRFVASVSLRGQNLFMSAKKLSGETYLVFPVKPKPVRRR
ncbi:MAG TPA: hypothetical protein VMZ11_09615 [Mycobacteriales bacterium]|nr:hypothetical protein [Mycobacteriales bacterium]